MSKLLFIDIKLSCISNSYTLLHNNTVILLWFSNKYKNINCRPRHLLVQFQIKNLLSFVRFSSLSEIIRKESNGVKIQHVLRLNEKNPYSKLHAVSFFLPFRSYPSSEHDERQPMNCCCCRCCWSKMIMSISQMQRIYMELVGLPLVVVAATVMLIMPCASPYIMHHLSEEQQFAMQPQDQVAVAGTRVILPCRVINKKGTVCN